MNHEKLQELLALYVLDILAPGERAEVEAHLTAGCVECNAERREFDAAAVAMAFSVQPVEPPARVRDAILRAAADPGVAGTAERPLQVWRNWSEAAAPGGFTLVRADDGEWSRVMAGIEVKRLNYDAERRLATMLVRMQPGTSYPTHCHALAEECLVVEGDLHVGEELVMHAGDFQRAERGSVHVPQYTVGGCLLFITSSLEDELLA